MIMPFFIKTVDSLRLQYFQNHWTVPRIGSQGNGIGGGMNSIPEKKWNRDSNSDFRIDSSVDSPKPMIFFFTFPHTVCLFVSQKIEM
jgi:hypothetical protein